MPVDLRSRALGAGYAVLARPVLFRAFRGDAEAVHSRTVQAVSALGGHRSALAAVRAAVAPHREPVELLGLTFPNRVGLAAGMDKDGLGVAAWGSLGFGHVELGTVTALPQPGNPRPRLARLPRSRALVNRMGFNNAGAHALAARLRDARAGGLVDIPVGVSIGKSKVTPVDRAVEDYLTSVRALDGLADYLAVNVSSPNTPGLRGLQDAGPLADLLGAVVAETVRLGAGAARAVPVLVKIAPDLEDAALEQALAVALQAGVSGVIATNTTTSREGVDAREAGLAAHPGGLSGAPLAGRARRVVSAVRRVTDLPVIGVGGVLGGADARALADAGADLVQTYTGLVYAGPALVREAALALSGRPPR